MARAKAMPARGVMAPWLKHSASARAWVRPVASKSRPSSGQCRRLRSGENSHRLIPSSSKSLSSPASADSVLRQVCWAITTAVPERTTWAVPTATTYI